MGAIGFPDPDHSTGDGDSGKISIARPFESLSGPYTHAREFYGSLTSALLQSAHMADSNPRIAPPGSPLPVSGTPSSRGPASSKTTWSDRFRELLAYRKIHGDCKVPKGWPENPRLGQWVVNQRNRRKKGGLREEFIRRLDEIGFDWSIRVLRWEQCLLELVEFRRKAGHCNVPPRWTGSPALANWVRRQRSDWKSGRLPEDRLNRLKALGFEREGGLRRKKRLETAWQEFLHALGEFKRTRGHCRVPKGWPANPGLAQWVVNQRSRAKSGTLRTDRLAELDELGFEWEIKVEQQTRRVEGWNRMIAALVEYKALHGDCRVPLQYPGNPQLGRWVSRQRFLRKRGGLGQDRLHVLDELRFEWSVMNREWENRFAQLTGYRSIHDTCDVPLRKSGFGGLGHWVRTQRKNQAKGVLRTDRVRRLSALGFRWSKGRGISPDAAIPS
jgi:hypothetical protein